jgi:hypothetical protein
LEHHPKTIGTSSQDHWNIITIFDRSLLAVSGGANGLGFSDFVAVMMSGQLRGGRKR